jgi:hypothetical protein
VKARATRYAYGVNTKVMHDSSNYQHSGRRIIEDLEGDVIFGVWSQIVPKVSYH